MKDPKASSSIKKRILVAEDDEAICGSIKKALEKEGYEVTVATNGKVAQDLVGFDGFDAVLSDIHMPGSRVSGLELLQYVVKLPVKVPVVLMTGFATLTETKEAFETGAVGFLAKPFRREELIKTMRAVLYPDGSAAALPDAKPEGGDDNYCKLNLDDFVSGKKIDQCVYVRLSADKYVKIAHQGEDIPAERIRSYKEKGIRHLYLTKDDFHAYIRFNIGLAHAVRKSSQITREKKLNLMKHAGELVLEYLYSDQLQPEVFGEAKAVLETTLGFLMESDDTGGLIEALNAHSDCLYAHSLGTSLYAAMICREVGWSAPQTIYKISTAALLHDIGMKEIDRALVDKPRASTTAEDARVLKTHAGLGMEILSTIPSMSSDIIQMVGQHHERDSGLGYPSGLNKGRIHPMARLIAVADEFCELAIKGPGYAGLAPKAAAERLRLTHGGLLEPQYLEALGRLLGIAPLGDKQLKKAG